MSKENKLIPDLRFPEFVNNGEWVGDTLINIAKFRRGSFPQPYGLPEWYDNENGMPFIQVYDVGDDFRLKPTTKSKISKLAAEQSVFIKKGTVIITIQGSIGRVAITQYDAYIDRTLLLFEEFYNEIDKTFFAYVLFLLFEIEKQKAPGGIIKTITKEVLSDFVVSFPQPKEQQKIASCLSSLDELIAAHNDKLQALKDHKKGLMQNLFPQDGETSPNFRFPEFEGDGEWVEKKLGDVFASYSGGTPSTTEKEFYGGDIPFIRSAEISSKSTELFLTKVGLNNSSAKMVSKGDLLIALYGANSGDVAISKIDGAINQAILCLKSDFSNSFTYHYFSYKKSWIVSRYIQGGQGNLSGDIVKSIVLSFPKEQEQQKIASCLSALDELITAQSEKIEQLQQHKKGLMQGLFPKINK